MSVIAVAMNGTPSTDSATEVSTRTNQAMLSLAATLATKTKWKNTRNYWDLPASLCSRLAKQHICQQDVKLARSDGKDGVNVYLRKGLHKSCFSTMCAKAAATGGAKPLNNVTDLSAAATETRQAHKDFCASCAIIGRAADKQEQPLFWLRPFFQSLRQLCWV